MTNDFVRLYFIRTLRTVVLTMRTDVVWIGGSIWIIMSPNNIINERGTHYQLKYKVEQTRCLGLYKQIYYKSEKSVLQKPTSVVHLVTWFISPNGKDHTQH